jgi:hypothetical protein
MGSSKGLCALRGVGGALRQDLKLLLNIKSDGFVSALHLLSPQWDTADLIFSEAC